MKVTIEDTWFPPGTRIRVGGGADELSFVRCTFEGGEIIIEPDVDQTIFLDCVFQHTRFSGEPLSERISVGCQKASVATEAAMTTPAARHARFRR
jgi:hypothetical protein